VHGILVLDKPPGISSNDALQQVKRIYQAAKAGHTGSLDMIATGLLPLCLGEATKLSGFLLEADKRYHSVCRLGVTTTTGDSDGEVEQTRALPALDAARVEEVLQHFRGAIRQVPPMYSALKHHGRRLYELARQGIEVERAAREVRIHALRLLQLGERQLTLEVHCSKGTYVRTLVADVGEMLGCGAHVVALRRLQAGPFREDQAVTMERLQALQVEGLAALDALLLPAEAAVSDYPELTLGDSAAWYLHQGQPVLIPRAPTDGLLRLYNKHHRFLGMGEVLSDGRVAPRRLLRQA